MDAPPTMDEVIGRTSEWCIGATMILRKLAEPGVQADFLAGKILKTPNLREMSVQLEAL